MKTTTLRKFLVVVPGTFLIYLLEACVMDYLPLFGVKGSLLFAFIAVIIVSAGKKGAFCASAIIGILTETMLSVVKGMYVVAYPLITMLWAQAFADRSDRQREKREMLHPNRKQEDPPAMLRIVLAAACMTLTMQAVQLVYIYLAGAPVTLIHFTRAFLIIAWTTGLAAVIAFPIRFLLGLYRRDRKPEQKGQHL